MNDFTKQLQALSQRVKHTAENSNDLSSDKNNFTEGNIEKEVLLYETEDGNVSISVFFITKLFG